jgi:protein-tyrosine phosphatase
MMPDLFRIPGRWPGKLIVSTRPRGGEWLADEVAGWARAEVNTIVSLLESEEASELGLAEEQLQAESNGLRFFSFPIPDRGVPSSSGDTAELLQRLTAELESGRSVALHCRQGVGRSGMMGAALLVTAGMTPRNAAKVVSRARGIEVPETAGQLEWLEHLASEYPVIA